MGFDSAHRSWSTRRKRSGDEHAINVERQLPVVDPKGLLARDVRWWVRCFRSGRLGRGGMRWGPVGVVLAAQAHEVGEQLAAVGRADGLGVVLDAPARQGRVAQAHQHSVGGPGRLHDRLGQRPCEAEGLVAHDLEVLRESLEAEVAGLVGGRDGACDSPAARRFRASIRVGGTPRMSNNSTGPGRPTLEGRSGLPRPGEPRVRAAQGSAREAPRMRAFSAQAAFTAASSPARGTTRISRR